MAFALAVFIVACVERILICISLILTVLIAICAIEPIIVCTLTSVCCNTCCFIISICEEVSIVDILLCVVVTCGSCIISYPFLTAKVTGVCCIALFCTGGSCYNCCCIIGTGTCLSVAFIIETNSVVTAVAVLNPFAPSVICRICGICCPCVGTLVTDMKRVTAFFAGGRKN